MDKVMKCILRIENIVIREGGMNGHVGNDIRDYYIMHRGYGLGKRK